MKRTLVSLGLLWLMVLCLRADQPKQTPRERFLALNPNYEKGVAEFYRRDYLPSAARAMAEAIKQEGFTEDDARRSLGTLIDDFLVKYVDGGGTITRAERGRLILAMDRAVRAKVKNEAALARYRKWRDTEDRMVNALSFLTTANDLHFTLPERVTDAGWAMKSLKLSDLEKYAGYFGDAPDHVLVFENPRLSKKEGKQASLMLLAFQSDRLRDKVLGREGPFRSEDKTLPAIDFFWQAGGALYFSSEGALPGPQAKLASSIKSLLVGQPRFEGKRVPID